MTDHKTIRLHYGFQTTGGHFIDFSDIKLESDEKPEDLYQRLVAFLEDNLLKQGGGKHTMVTLLMKTKNSPQAWRM